MIRIKGLVASIAAAAIALIALFMAISPAPAAAQTFIPGTPPGYHWVPFEISVDNPRLEISYVGAGLHTFDWEADFFHNQVVVDRNLPDGEVHALAFHLDTWNSTATFSLGTGGDIERGRWLVHYYQDHFSSQNFPWASNFKSSLEFNGFSSWTFTKAPFSPSAPASGSFTAYALVEGEVDEPPQTPEIGGFCVFSATITITDTTGITRTERVTYTRSVNRLSNPSFEQPSGPETTRGWSTLINGAHTEVPGHWFQLPGLARTGSGVIYNVAPYELWQSMVVYTRGLYVAGVATTGPGITVKWNGAPIAESGIVSEGYQVISGTYPGTSGGIYVILSFDGDHPTYADDAFAYYTDDEETLLPACDPAAFEPFDEASWGENVETVGGVPTPIGGAGTVCYTCIPPRDVSAAAVSYWIAWLACVLRNMFSCSLRVWLLVIGNWTSGVLEYFMAFAAWVPMTAQQGADWFMGSVVPSIGGTTIINQGSNFFDLFVAVIDLLQTLVTTLSNLLLGIVNLVSGLLQLIPTALSAEAYDFGFAGDTGGGGIGAPGANDDKRLYAFLLFLGIVDQLVIGHADIVPLLLLAMGAMTLGVIFWVAWFWRDIIHI